MRVADRVVSLSLDLAPVSVNEVHESPSRRRPNAGEPRRCGRATVSAPVISGVPHGAALRASAKSHRRSYWKTILAAGVVAICSAAVAQGVATLAAMHRVFPRAGGWLLASIAIAVLVGSMIFGILVAFGGSIALRRDALESSGRPYADLAPREARRSWIARSLRTVTTAFDRGAGSLHLCPGDRVVVRKLDEILATLDANGSLDGLPFMPEMIAFCGRPATVFRRIDKINDWIHREGLKRVHDVVQLDDARCTGEAHGGCESNCRLRWKEAWLRRVDAADRALDETHAPTSRDRLYQLARRDVGDGPTTYMCQATELATGATLLSARDPRPIVRDFATGNVRLRPLLSGVGIACFNWVQKTRGGVAFPHLAVPASAQSPTESLGLKPGDRVRIKSKERITRTINNQSRNRGLYFDPEMLRYCGGEYTVRGVIHRAIAERTGELRQLSTPSIVLEGVRNTGEYVGFNPEDEYIFWREIWLERLGGHVSA